MEKRWQIAQPVSADELKKFPELHPIVAQLLANRGLATQEQIDEFFNPDFSRDVHNPLLFRDGEKAARRVLEAIANEQRIVVYGDYDADGVSSSALLSDLLTALGGIFEVYIPFRETEGYGLNETAVKKLAANGAKLLISVDCGISNHREVEILQQAGVDVIVTDHHQQPLQLPRAFAVLNPNLHDERYPFRSLCGTGVAYKLAQAVCQLHREYPVAQLPEGFEKWLLDLVAIGTVADMMPLLGENRTLTTYGLVVLNKTRRVGLQKLIASLGNRKPEIDSRSIGFQIAPRINAAGRLNHANTAYQLLITTNSVEADDLVTELTKANQERQNLTVQLTDKAKQQLGEVKDQKLLVVSATGWPTGLLGLVAGRLSDEFYRPCLVISRFKDQIVGSGRSIPEFDITAALQNVERFLSRYGGHAQACGFTVKSEADLAGFISAMTTVASEQLAGQKLQPSLHVDAEVLLDQIDWSLVDAVAKFEPFGEVNPKPRFAIRGAEILQVQLVGQDSKHLRLTIRQGEGKGWKTIGFGFGSQATLMKPGDRVDMAVEIEVNEWNGNRELQLKIVDVHLNNG